MNKKILLIDDDREDAEIFEEALTEADDSAILIYMDDPREALDKLKKMHTEMPKIIFLDINMPFMTGWDCLQEIKKDGTLQHIPVIMYSTSSNQREAAMAAELGAAAYLTKPNDYNELKSKLKCLLSPL